MHKTTSSEQGFGLAELLVVVALLGILGALATPSLLSYYQTSSLSAGAEQLAATLNRGRHLAISQNRSVCVQRSGTTVRLRPTSTVPANCSGTIWTGVGTDSAGTITIANQLQVSGGNTIFSNAGGATAATYTLTDPKTGLTRSVVVATTGRVTIQ